MVVLGRIGGSVSADRVVDGPVNWFVSKDGRADPDHAWRLPRSRLRSRGSCPSRARPVARRARRPREQPVAKSPQSPETRPRVLGISAAGGSIIRPASGPTGTRMRRRKIGSSSLRAPVFGRFPGQIDLHQQGRSGGPPPTLAASTFRTSSGLSIEWIAVECAPPFRALFDCRWPMRCQASGRSCVYGSLTLALPGPCFRRSRSGLQRRRRERRPH